MRCKLKSFPGIPEFRDRAGVHCIGRRFASCDCAAVHPTGHEAGGAQEGGDQGRLAQQGGALLAMQMAV